MTTPGRPGDLETRMLDGLARKLGRPLPPGSGVIGGGRSGLPHLLATAARQSARYPLQILVGVESLLRQVIVEHYIARGRLLCGANTSGFTLREAASAIGAIDHVRIVRWHTRLPVADPFVLRDIDTPTVLAAVMAEQGGVP